MSNRFDSLQEENERLRKELASSRDHGMKRWDELCELRRKIGAMPMLIAENRELREKLQRLETRLYGHAGA